MIFQIPGVWGPSNSDSEFAMMVRKEEYYRRLWEAFKKQGVKDGKQTSIQ